VFVIGENDYGNSEENLRHW